jgi:hypothetical protein
MIACKEPTTHFPWLNRKIMATGICILCYTPMLPMSEMPKEPLLDQYRKIVGYPRKPR